MRITLEEDDKTVVIETNDVMTYDVINNLMLPALLAIMTPSG